MKTIITIVVSVIAAIQCLAATTWYVAKSGSDSNTGKSESAAFLTIQKAIDSSIDDDIVVVGDGIYAPISTDNKRITIESVNGRAKTIIDGQSSSRCAYLGVDGTETNTVLSGFLIQM